MKNKLIYLLPIVAVMIGLTVYLAINRPASKEEFPSQNINTESEATTQPQNEETKMEEVPTGDQKSLPAVPAEKGSDIVTDAFTVTPPPGWKGMPAPAGMLALAVNPNEKLADQGAIKIGFKSYLAVTKSDLQGKTKNEYISFIGEELRKVSSLASLDTVWNTRINGRDATVLDISTTQQNVDFKTSLFLVWDGESVWGISYNTTPEKWKDYQDPFFTSGSSFKLK